ncbi:MAG: tRNA (adenosine(37)-N6)-threonylcarbamoyltransferase complex ATPase subunit type 1 TsaE [Deltaproteobacteria bacterium CG_4_10_14_0_2_um_filter_43_8]|nr:MAG: tRNA (adenosine(37)-N6)-threonylcarbamoyltransferase complex ATPase subunit type 1 TsaE [Deltaproteobacteria bacterium CG11_big_fil_rev_8_21_14_0_20_42_23]PJA20392.1 MAG: tRNA (adenosine(37)-N6)-threonylcarbamoyltransferase complex ATPase subunit type 1 TsaE [Deltaproteobacteria bacterium CG_4_10_14_0_2_um_filter_43_8]PJC63791.1 MAG: tRNA (adenosine(37)-N6)-threonylcarbamoyltransferase complex ATPase subunit type 1 TsaE [Deltaproteobacteria bacterium CG_4_9_14_0_2_um_filter_42_21]
MILHSLQETQKMAKELASHLKKGDVLALSGELGAGKTTFIAALARALGVSETTYVSSPTFTIMNVYEGRVPLYHFDFYRLEHEDEVKELGMEEYLYGNGICFIEWAEKFPSVLPKNIYRLHFKVLSESERDLNIETPLVNA